MTGYYQSWLTIVHRQTTMVSASFLGKIKILNLNSRIYGLSRNLISSVQYNYENIVKE